MLHAEAFNNRSVSLTQNGGLVQLVNGRGPTGAPGQDGSNVLPTDEAIRDRIEDEGSLTSVALKASFQQITHRDESAAAHGVVEGAARADNTTAFNAAQAAATSTGARVIVPPGTLNLNAPTVTASVLGAGQGKTELNFDGMVSIGADNLALEDFTVSTSAAIPIRNVGFSDFAVRRLTLNRSTSVGDYQRDIRCTDVSRFIAEDLVLFGEGIEVVNTTDYRITGSVFDFNYQNHYRAIHASRESNGTIDGNVFRGIYGHDVIDSYSSGKQSIITNNRMIGLRTAVGIMCKVVFTDSENNSSIPPDDIIHQLHISDNVIQDIQSDQELQTPIFGIYVDWYDERTIEEFLAEESAHTVLVHHNTIEDVLVDDNETDYVNQRFVGISVTAQNSIISKNIIRNVRDWTGGAHIGIALGTQPTNVNTPLIRELHGVQCVGNEIAGIEDGVGIQHGTLVNCKVDGNVIGKDHVSGRETTMGIQGIEDATAIRTSFDDNTIDIDDVAGNAFDLNDGQTYTDCSFRLNKTVGPINLASALLDCNVSHNQMISARAGMTLGVTGTASMNLTAHGNKIEVADTIYAATLFDIDTVDWVGGSMRDSKGLLISGTSKNVTLAAVNSIDQAASVPTFPTYSGVSDADKATSIVTACRRNGVIIGFSELDAFGHLSVSVLRQQEQQRIALRRTTGLAETFSRSEGLGSSTALTTSRLTMFAIYLLKGTLVSNITFMAGTTAGAGMSHAWYSLWDAATLTQRGVTVDDVSATWTANTEKTLALSTPYSIPADGLYYLGLVITATTMPTIASHTILTGSGQLTPIICGLAGGSTYATGPGSAPNPAPTPSTTYSSYAYAWVS